MSTENLLLELQQAYLSNLPLHLEEMESLILDMEKGQQIQENFESLFRRVHSLKGSGGTYGFTIITSVCHQLEDFLSDEVSAQGSIDKSKINTLFEYVDILKDTQSLLLDEKDNFTAIENRLQEIKQYANNPKLRALFIGQAENLNSQLCLEILKNANIHCTIITSGITAFQRLLHEHFDLLITSRENPELSGTALIAALKLNKRRNVNIKTILITSNPQLDIPQSLQPDFIVLKDRNFNNELSNIINNLPETII